MNISIHSPYTGRDDSGRAVKGSLEHFNPLSLYRERLSLMMRWSMKASISIHSPYTGRDITGGRVPRAWYAISIHSPYTGRDGIELAPLVTKLISIHSPYTGRDSNFAHKTPNIQPILLCKTPNKRTFSNTYTTNYNFPSPHIINIQVRISLHFHVHFTFALNHSRI